MTTIDPGFFGADDILAEAEALRRSGVLGRPGQLSRLFDYLADSSIGNEAPSESEIAIRVFNRPADFLAGQDAVVRVNIHRLRKRLEDYYLRGGAGRARQLTLPRGEYRLALADGPAPGPFAPAATSSVDARAHREPVAPPAFVLSRRQLFGGAAGLVGAGAALGAAGGWLGASEPRADLLSSPFWTPFASRDAPLLVVLGDYYIFADTDERGNVLRLTREFFINSRDELYRYMMENDDLHYRYMDLDLRYLPTAVGPALRALAPLLARHPQAPLIGASALTPQMLRDHNVVYVGYLSGLGILRDPTFRGARFTPGSSFDEILDGGTGRTYASEGATAPPPPGLFRDYGYVTRFPGPGGRQIAILAGTRDVGVSGAVEAISDRAFLDRLPRTSASGALEALFEIEGRGDANLKARLLSAVNRRAEPIWTTGDVSPS